MALAKARELFTALAVVGVSAWMQRRLRSVVLICFDGDGANGSYNMFIENQPKSYQEHIYIPFGKLT